MNCPEYHQFKIKVINDIFQYVWFDYNPTQTKEYIRDEITFVIDNVFKQHMEEIRDNSGVDD